MGRRQKKSAGRFLRFVGNKDWREYAPVSLRARGRRGSGAVPLSLQKNAKGGEQSAQLADAQTSAACPPTHSPASQEEARLPAQRVCARRLTGAVRWRFEGKVTEGRSEKGTDVSKMRTRAKM